MVLNQMKRACAISLLCVAGLAAQPANTTPGAVVIAPTSAPTTRSSVASDQSTPRGALKLLMIAMNKGDFDTAKGIFLPSGERETKMVDALIGQQQVMLKYRDASVKAFGADEAKKLVGDIDGDQAKGIEQLETSSEQITGDDAVITDPEQQQVKLKKQDGKWTISVVNLFPQIPPDKIDFVVANVARQKKVFDETTSEITAGKYKSADEVGKALQMKMFELQAQLQGEATSQPATAPAELRTNPTTQP